MVRACDPERSDLSPRQARARDLPGSPARRSRAAYRRRPLTDAWTAERLFRSFRAATAGTLLSIRPASAGDRLPVHRAVAFDRRRTGHRLSGIARDRPRTRVTEFCGKGALPIGKCAGKACDTFRAFPSLGILGRPSRRGREKFRARPSVEGGPVTFQAASASRLAVGHSPSIRIKLETSTILRP